MGTTAISQETYAEPEKNTPLAEPKYEEPEPAPRTRQEKRVGIRIILDKVQMGKTKIGMDITQENNNIKVHKIKEGLAQDWNELHPDCKVLAGDIILDVNGVRGNFEAMMQRIMQDDRLNILLMRTDQSIEQ